MAAPNEKLAETIAQMLDDDNLIHTHDHDEVRKLLASMLPPTDAEVDAVFADNPLPPPREDSPLAKLRKSLRADGLSLRCTLEAAAKRVAEAEDEKRRRVYYQDIVYAVCTQIELLDGWSIVCGTVDDPTTEVQDSVALLIKCAQKST